MTAAVAASPPELLLGPGRFDTWLHAQPSNAIVGVPESLFSCPLASFLKAEGVQSPVVGPMVLRWDVPWTGSVREAPKYLLPDWCADFVKRVDERPGEVVTAERALAVLRAVVG